MYNPHQYNPHQHQYYRHYPNQQQIPILLPQRQKIVDQLQPELNNLKNAIYVPIKSSPNYPSHIYVHEEIAENKYMENAVYLFIFIIMIFLLLALLCCRYRSGVRIFRGIVMLISWLFWALLSYILSLIIFILSFIRKMISWIWQTTLIGSTLEGYEFWYWGQDKRKVIEIDGISYIQQ